MEIFLFSWNTILTIQFTDSIVGYLFQVCPAHGLVKNCVQTILMLNSWLDIGWLKIKKENLDFRSSDNCKTIYK